jgi:hypothetical protein
MGCINNPGAIDMLKILQLIERDTTTRSRWRKKLYFADCDHYVDTLMEGLRRAGMPE